MKNIIDQDWFHPNIQWHQFDQGGNEIIMNRADIMAGIDHWCNILKEVADFGPGSTCVSLQEITDIRYLTLMWAVWRMGGCMISTNVDPSVVPRVDCAVYNQEYLKIDESDPIVCYKNQDLFDSITSRSRHVIEANTWFDYVADTTKTYEFPEINPTDNLLMVSFPGQDGNLETTTFTHEFFSALSERQKNLFKFGDQERVLHLHVINHGGAECNILIPSLRFCQHHYNDAGKDSTRHPNIATLIAQQKINNVDCIGGNMIDSILKLSSKFNQEVSFYQLAPNWQYWVPVIKEKNVKQIISMYGTSATCGPVLLNVMTQDADDQFDVLNYGTPRDNFYQVQNIDGTAIEVHNQYRGTKLVHDCFVNDDQGNFVFSQKNNQVRIRNVWTTVEFFDSLNNVVSQMANNKACLVPDGTFDQIYLMVDSSMTQTDLDQLVNDTNHQLNQHHRHYCIDQVLTVDDITIFLIDHEVNKSHVRRYARKQLKFTN